MNILSLFARIGLSADVKQAQQIESQFKGMVTTLKTVALGTVAVSAGILKIVDDSLKAAVAFKQFEAETGASSQELQRWQAVASQTNVSTEALSDAVRNLSDNRQKIKLGQGNISGFQLLGIDPDQDPFMILEQLKAKTEGLAPAMKKTVLSQMGISSQLIQILELTNSQFQEMKDNAFVIPSSAINSLSQANAALAMAGKAVDWLKSLIGTKLAPEIQRITKLFVSWIKENKEGLINGFKVAFDVISRFVTMIVRVSSMLYEIGDRTLGWKNIIIGLAGAFVILNRALFLSPIGLITAGVLALMMVLEDLYVYSKGGKSLFGEFAKSSPEFKKILDGVLGIFSDIAKLIKALTTMDMSSFFGVTSKWGALGTILNIVAGALKTIVDTITALLQLDMNKAFKALTENDVWKDLHLTDKDIGKFFGDMMKSVGLGGSSSSSSTTNNIGIYSNQDPGEIAKEVAKKIQEKNTTELNKNAANRTGTRVN